MVSNYWKVEMTNVLPYNSVEKVLLDRAVTVYPNDGGVFLYGGVGLINEVGFTFLCLATQGKTNEEPYNLFIPWNSVSKMKIHDPYKPSSSK